MGEEEEWGWFMYGFYWFKILHQSRKATLLHTAEI